MRAHLPNAIGLAMIAVLGIALVASSFSAGERQTISRLKARLAAVEQAQVTQAADIARIDTNGQAMATDIDTLGGNDETLQADVARSGSPASRRPRDRHLHGMRRRT